MWSLIKNANIFAPEPLETHDLLVVGNQIAAIGNDLSLPSYSNGQVYDLQGNYLVPGFIDAHVHICGGGGEAGPSSRTPEVQLSQLTQAGITTVVGCLGTDSLSRSMEGLLVKANALEEEGLTCYVYSGGYQADRMVFDNLRKDLVLIDKVIGAGEIAISDHRSAQPQISELERLAAGARVGGMLGHKAGIVHIHLGEGKRGLSPIWRIVEDTEIPITQFMPTHINRKEKLLKEGVEFLKAGGTIDLTAGCDDFEPHLHVPFVLNTLYEQGLLNDRVTVTSDGNGSLPQYNEAGALVGMGIGSVHVLWRDVREAINEYKIPLEIVLPTITSNPARILKLKGKGMIRQGYDGDLVALTDDLRIDKVWARGKIMIRDRMPVVFGMFETSLASHLQTVETPRLVKGRILSNTH
ncbi:MAG: beta-aspartyl-peptidase [Desulfitobacterium sp.]